MFSKGIPITPRAHLRHNCTELGGEPGGATTPLRRHSAPNLHNHERREETGGPPASNIPPTGNGVLFDGVVPPKAEGRSLMLPKVWNRSHNNLDVCDNVLLSRGGSFVSNVPSYPPSLGRTL